MKQNRLLGKGCFYQYFPSLFKHTNPLTERRDTITLNNKRLQSILRDFSLRFFFSIYTNIIEENI